MATDTANRGVHPEDEDVEDTEEKGSSSYVSTSTNYHRRVLRAARRAVRESKKKDSPREFRSVSQFVNFHLAKILNVDLT